MNRFLSTFMVIFVISFFCKTDLKGQDIHFSQFYNSPLNINPALTGIFNGDMRFIGSVRDQWRSVPVPYLTFSGNYDMKVYPKKMTKGFFGLGAIFNYDNAGDGNFNVSDLNLTGSYSYLLNSKNILTGGILLGVASEGLSTDTGLTWDNYWTGAVIDPALGSGEPFVGNERFTYLETGAGINYRFQQSKRTNFNIGAGFFHLNQPTSSFDKDKTSSLPIRTTISADGSFQVADPVDIQVHGVANLQSVYSEYVFGLLGRIHINQNKGKEYALDLGASARISDNSMLSTISPTMALHFNQFYVGASYDINLTQVVSALGIKRGGPEVHVRYIITNVKPLSEQKACPIF